jgi:hypothetical protein
VVYHKRAAQEQLLRGTFFVFCLGKDAGSPSFWSAVASGIPRDTALTRPRKAVPRSSGSRRTLLVTALQKELPLSCFF